MKSILTLLVYVSLAANDQNVDGPLIVVRTADATTQFEVTLLSDYSMPPINPEWIESISVLKDAVSTGRYGMRGANGVVIITISNEYGAEIPGNMERIIDTSHRTGIMYVLQNQKGTAEYTINKDTGFGLANLKAVWIEAIEVMKDGAASKKYGKDAAAGAVIIRISSKYINELPEDIRNRLSE